MAKTVRKAVDEYLADHEAIGTFSQATLKNRRYELERFALFCERHNIIDVAKCSKNVITKYIGTLNVSKRTKRTILSVLGAFFNYCVDEGIVLENPVEGIPAPRTHPPEPDTLTPDELSRFFQSIVETSRVNVVDRNLLLASLLLSLCLRISEALNICIEDIDLPATANSENAGFVRIKRKGGKENRLPLSVELHNLFQVWLEQRKRFSGTESGYLFISQRGNRLSPRQAHKMIKLSLSHANIVKRIMGPHLLRHTGASQYIANGMNIRTVQHLLGHSSLAITNRYVHLVEETGQIRNGIQNLSLPTPHKQAQNPKCSD